MWEQWTGVVGDTPELKVYFSRFSTKSIDRRSKVEQSLARVDVHFTTTGSEIVSLASSLPFFDPFGNPKTLCTKDGVILIKCVPTINVFVFSLLLTNHNSKEVAVQVTRRASWYQPFTIVCNKFGNWFIRNMY
ncbi:hypothetical protein L1987_13986 [Smallanthus sonchifolius]|uniref:Uncharacterized protein n=1 Tax=Smallanthus sonchifolius TaxID=185202 RepID=A0ACB9JKC4_9ASTR|nr:hypothetical protein L1987_13986 [Smallanthus sonchifolius]